ncbi:TPA: hypothetical protein N0F65_007263, partial [Lagenidium giganteum]
MRRPRLALWWLPLWASIGVGVTSKGGFEGRATMYGLTKPIGGSCSVRKAPAGVQEDMFVAMNRQQYANSASCSRCLSIKGPKGTAMAYAADFCYECGQNNLDLNPIVWEKVIGGDPRIEAISWEFVACPDDSVKFCLKEGSNDRWLALQVANSRDGVQKLTINGMKTQIIGVTSFYQLSSGEPVDMNKLEVQIESISGKKSTHTVGS